MDYKWLFTLLITIGGWCMSIGMYLAKVKQHDKEIDEIKNRQNTTENNFNTALQSINNTLIDLNTKMNLLLGGKIKEGQAHD